MCSLYIIFCVVLGYFVEIAISCNGYQLRTHYIRNCKGGKDIVQIRNISVSMDSDCNVIFNGCAIITKDFQTAMNRYQVKKPPMPTRKGEVDMCEALKSLKNSGRPSVAVLMTSVGISSCPIKKGRVCSKGPRKINIAQFKNQLSLLAGRTEVVADIEHNNGASCIEAAISFLKK